MKMMKYLAVVSLTLLLGAAQANADSIYASNFGANTITKYDEQTGTFLGTVVTAGPELSGVAGVKLGPDGNLYVSGQFSNNVVRYNAATGTLLGILDPANAAGLSSPQGMVFGPDGNLYVVSAANDRIVRYDPVTGNFLDTFAIVNVPAHNGPITPAFAGGFLFLSAFDSGDIFKLDANTGALVDTFVGPPGFGFGDLVIGPDGNVYAEALDFSDFSGSILRYDAATGAMGTFIANGTGGLSTPGGLVFGSDGYLYVANLMFDASFNDTGSAILRFDSTGAFVDQPVGPGQGLNLPFFLADELTVPATVPEPGTFWLLATCLCGLAITLLRTRV